MSATQQSFEQGIYVLLMGHIIPQHKVLFHSTADDRQICLLLKTLVYSVLVIIESELYENLWLSNMSVNITALTLLLKLLALSAKPYIITTNPNFKCEKYYNCAILL